jgi:hypothetical protein
MTPADNEQSQRKLGQQSGVSGKLGFEQHLILLLLAALDLVLGYFLQS